MDLHLHVHINASHHHIYQLLDIYMYMYLWILCYKGYQLLAAGDGVPALKIKITNNKQDKLFNYIQGTCKFNSQYSR